MSSKRRRHGDEKSNVKVPVAKRTRATLKSSWEEHKSSYKLRNQPSTFETIASKVANGGSPSKSRESANDNTNVDHSYDYGDGDRSDEEESNNVNGMNLKGFKLDKVCKNFMQVYGNEVVEGVFEMLRDEIKKQVVKVVNRVNNESNGGCKKNGVRVNLSKRFENACSCEKDEEEEEVIEEANDDEDIEEVDDELVLALSAEKESNGSVLITPKDVKRNSRNTSLESGSHSADGNQGLVHEKCVGEEAGFVNSKRAEEIIEIEEEYVEKKDKTKEPILCMKDGCPHPYEKYVMALSAEEQGFSCQKSCPLPQFRKRSNNASRRDANRGGMEAARNALVPVCNLKPDGKNASMPEKGDKLLEWQGTQLPEKDWMDDLNNDLDLAKGDTVLNKVNSNTERNAETVNSRNNNFSFGNWKQRKTTPEGNAKNRSKTVKTNTAFSATENPFGKLLMSIFEESKIPSVQESIFESETLSKEEQEYAEIWRDMELALNGCEADSATTTNSKTLTGKTFEKMLEDFCCNDNFDEEVDLPFMCEVGEHEFVLDEEIGVFCRVCKFVKQEIRSILPPMQAEFRKKKKNKFYDDDEEDEEPAYLRELDLENQKFESSIFEAPHPSEKTVWDFIPDLKETMHIHQSQGFEFLWRNVAGSLILEKMKPPTSEEVGGCIISHAPGTGKTLLTISFLRTYLEVFPRSRPMLVVPVNMLCPWEAEFRLWGMKLPVYNLKRWRPFWNDICLKKQYADIVELAKNSGLKKSQKKNLARLLMIKEWHTKRSVLTVSYKLFVDSTGHGKSSLPEELKHIGQLLLERPGLLILDEGHQARNENTKIWLALQNVKTKLRIILSGTIFQNNFKELFNTLYLVRPSFFHHHFTDMNGMTDQNSSTKDGFFTAFVQQPNERESRKLFMDEIGNKIENCHEESDKILAKFRVMTSKFVHCYEGKVLNSLPGLRDFAVILKPTSEQELVLKQIANLNKSEGLRNFEVELMVSVVSIHPTLYRDFENKRLSQFSFEEIKRNDPSQGIKTKFVLDIVKLATKMDEKVLIFSQNLPPLRYMAEVLETHLSLRRGIEVLQLDGSLTMEDRQDIISQFNKSESIAKVLLASIRSCSEGISLVGASRVVFLDLVWNPSVIKQAISRAFRLGQKKYVYVYRLLASGTMEEEKYRRTVWKDCLSKLVFQSKENKNEKQESCKISERENLQETQMNEDKLLNRLLELDRDNKEFHSIFEHTSEHAEIKKNSNPKSGFMQDYFRDYYIS